jgi:PAS domain S-box-containing protein
MERSRGWIDLHLYAMAAAAALTGLLLWWTNASWRENFVIYPPMRGNLRQSRADIVKGYLAVERNLAGETSVRLADVDAFMEQAVHGMDKLLASLRKPEMGRDVLAQQSPDLDNGLRAYRHGIVRFQQLLRQSLLDQEQFRAQRAVERHAAFAELEKLGDGLDDAIERWVLAVAKRQDRLNRVLFFVWLSFLAILALTLTLAGNKRRKAEAALSESENRYRSLFDEVMDVILVVDAGTGRILDCNQAVATQWGYDREELLGRDPSWLRPPPDGQAHPDVAAAADGPRAPLREIRLATRFGEIRDLSVKAGFFTLGDRDVRLEIYNDVTERKRSENALLEREATLRGLGDNLPDGLIYKIEVRPDGTRRFLYVSRGVERLFGLSAKVALADTGAVFARYLPEDLDVLRRAETLSLRALGTFDVQARFRDATGAVRWGQLRAAPRRAPEGGVVFDGILVDITEYKRVEERLRQAMATAESASRAKSEFLANISHEVRTPLNGVLGMLQLLESSRLSPEDADHVATALACCRGLVRVLTDILDFTLIESGKLVLRNEPCDVRALAAEVLSVFTLESARKGLDVAVVVDPATPARVMTDVARLRQILFNVVGNAVKFTSRGAVRLDVRQASAIGEAVHLLFAVSDTGIGIPEEQMEAIFEPFTQIDGSFTRKYGGTGLGLGIVKRLVGLLDGHITVDSVPGQGTEFAFAIRCRPLAPQEARIAPVAASAPGQDGPVRVLVVEDEAVNRLATVSMLRKLGFAADAAEDGDVALDALEESDYDVVLMDIQMPRVSGDEATRRIRRGERIGIDPGIQIIALTAHAMAGDRERCLACGMNDYLSKPVDLAALGQAVTRAASQRRGGGA